MAKMRVAQVASPGGNFEIVDREIPQPETGWVRIRVQACGICHSDTLVKDGLWPGLQFPRVPGHEVVGVIDAVGTGVTQWKPGQRVGVGWHGGHCGYCDACRNGDFFGCQVALQITGISFDGGYAEYMLAPAIAVALMPVGLPPADAAPLMCAGITTFNALRNSGARVVATSLPCSVLVVLDISAFNMPSGWVSKPSASRGVRTKNL
jgi:D-arabinose 1-dehydrogenase-like Zn-dependent alcohol dehydrogenase